MTETYDKSYLAEKATLVLKGAQEILDALEKPNEKWNRSYYVDGILRIEDGLAALHMKTREIMKQCGETEKEYMLRNMGEVVRGK
jgi:hypothetical protein